MDSKVLRAIEGQRILLASNMIQGLYVAALFNARSIAGLLESEGYDKASEEGQARAE